MILRLSVFFFVWGSWLRWNSRFLDFGACRPGMVSQWDGDLHINHFTGMYGLGVGALYTSWH
jgi:hypothetical protein